LAVGWNQPAARKFAVMNIDETVTPTTQNSAGDGTFIIGKAFASVKPAAAANSDKITVSSIA